MSLVFSDYCYRIIFTTVFYHTVHSYLVAFIKMFIILLFLLQCLFMFDLTELFLFYQFYHLILLLFFPSICSYFIGLITVLKSSVFRCAENHFCIRGISCFTSNPWKLTLALKTVEYVLKL